MQNWGDKALGQMEENEEGVRRSEAFLLGGDGEVEFVPTRPIEQSRVVSFLKEPAEGGIAIGAGEVEALVVQKYPRGGLDFFESRDFWTFCKSIGAATDDKNIDLGRLRQLQMLDFGCGNVDRVFSGDFAKPWFCRAMHTLGVKVTGVDLHPPYAITWGKSLEDWDFVEADLMKSDSLDVIPRNSVDVVNCNAVIDHSEPHCHAQDPQLLDYSYLEMDRAFFMHALRVLRPGGVFIVDTYHIYQKVGGPVMFYFERLQGREVAHVKDFVLVDDSFLS